MPKQRLQDASSAATSESAMLRNRTSADGGNRTLPDLKLAVTLAMAVAVTMLAIWYWSRICRFPTIAWNDMRLAPAVALARGISVYPTSDHGTISTWIYGPLPILYYQPAAWAASAAGALVIGAFLNVALTLIPLALVCFMWPAWNRDADTWRPRAIAFVLCLALWPARHYEVIFADNLAIACGLLGNLVLMRARGTPALWLAAFVGSAAVACKQIALGIPLAQIVWLGVTIGPRAALLHAARCTLFGFIIGGLAWFEFGGSGLWFVLMKLPSQFSWEFASPRLLSAIPEAMLQFGLPLVTMIWGRRVFSRPMLLLPAIAWGCTVPLGVMALLKTGGWLNSWHSLVLWFPPVLVALFTAGRPFHFQRWLQLGGVVTAAALACARVITAPTLPLRPQVNHYHVGSGIAARLPGQVWFPLHPIITLYSDGCFYHDEDGFYERKVARMGIALDHAAAHLPPKMHTIAFFTEWSDWGIARNMLPSNARPVFVGAWALWSAPAVEPPR